MLKISSIILALVATPALAGNWTCEERTDRMDGSVHRSWSAESSNWGRGQPWSGMSKAYLTVAADEAMPMAVLLPIDSILDCPRRGACPARVSIDGKMVSVAFQALDNDVVAAAIEPADLAAAHQVKVEVPLYRQGPSILVFDLPGQAPASCPLL